MENLITRAIQAIKDDKTEYAIGLLEGALEMTGGTKPFSSLSVADAMEIDENENKDVIVRPIYTTKDESTPSLSNTRIEEIKRMANEGLSI